jgi:MSHA biogenesis protein MshL
MVVSLDPGAANEAGGSTATDPGSRLPQPAPRRDQLSPLPVTRLDEPGASVTLDAARPLSLRFAEPAPVRNVLMLLVRDTGLSLVTEPEVEGQFIGELRNVSLRRALDLVLHPLDLDYRVDGSAIRVFRRRPTTRFFDINLSAVVRSADVTTTAATTFDAKDPGSRSSVRSESMGRHPNDVAAGIQSLLSSDGRFALDSKAGVVQVTDYPERLDRIALYLESLERRLNHQVEIQAQVIEVTLEDPAVPSVDWAAAIEKSRTPTASHARSISFGTLLTVLGEQGSVSVLASPRLQVLHNEPALMRIGIQDVTFVHRRDAAEDDESSASIGTVLDGFTLSVTPQIGSDGVVTMSIAPSVTMPTGETRSQDGQRVPVLAVDELNTAVRVRDGETLVLPGLRRARDRQVVEDSKGLIGLFRRERTQPARSELAVLLTPTIRR